MNDVSQRSRYEARLQRVLDYIYEHLDEPLDVNRLADIACLSPYHWHRIYQGLYGETVATTVRRLRLHRAAGLLAYGTLPISEIATLSGYSSLQSFTRTFGAVYGMPPARYRKEGNHSRFRPALSGGDAMEQRSVEIRNVPAMEVVSIDHSGDYMQIGKAFDTLDRWLAARNLLGPDTRMIGIYYDDPGVVPTAQLRSKAGAWLPRKVEVEAPFSVTQVRGGQYAVLRHKGPYADLPAAYEWLYGQWLVKSGREADDTPAFEEYLNDPKHTAPAELLTEIYLPLR
ncbi:MAG TPA: AraC family transcriptional regulator [Paraburkholderia sp.]|jgi:AraC family transcriptional regulator|nr:AraC family transcriptional regulator [Paraburkholderia sp.]